MYHNGAMEVAAVKESESSEQTSDMGRPQRIELKGQELKDYISSLVPDWCRPLPSPNLKLEDGMTRIFEAEAASGRLGKDELIRAKKYVYDSCRFAENMYYSFPLEVKLVIATLTGLYIMVDDLADGDTETSKRSAREFLHFVNNWGDKSQAHQFNPHLNHCVRMLTVEVPKYYGPVATSNITQSGMNFIIATALEIRYHQKGINCPETSSRYPGYLRNKSGLSETYAHFQFPKVLFPEEEYLETYLPTIPDIQKFTNIINDVLSFYKENVAGTEESSYLMVMSRIHGCNPMDMWRDICKEVPPLVKDISATLSRREELQKPWNQYIDGYIRWHIESPRYRLAEIGVTCPEQ